MASHQNIDEELECPICKDYFKVPKLMGRCLHVACLKCLEQLVASRRTDFPCPVCQRKCKIPTQGVAALKDDFRIRAILEKYQHLKKEKNFIHCSACPSNPASHFCKECGKIYLCIACSGKHSRNPLTNAHKLVGVCCKHGKSLTMYCRKCNAAICSVCLMADHASNSRDHDVESHEKVADEEFAEVASAVYKLEKTIKEKESALYNLMCILASLCATIDTDLSLLDTKLDNVMERSNKTRADLIAEKGSIQKQIEALNMREKAVDEKIVATEKKMAADRQKKKEYADYLKSYRSARKENIEKASTQAMADTDDMHTNLELGRKGKSMREVIDYQSVPTLLKIKEGLRQTLTTAEQVDRAAQFVDVEERMPRFVPASDHTEIGFIRREYATLNKFADISFRAYRACKSMGSLKHLPDGRLACLYQTEDYQERRSLGDTIMLHDLSAFPATRLVVLERNITAVAMTVTSKGEWMVLDNSDFVRIFNSDDGYRDTHLNHDHSDSSCFTSFECDDEDNMFVGFWDFLDFSDSSADSLCVFNPDGVLITEISESGLHGVKLMSYCRLRRVIYLLVPPNIILRYHWDGITVSKMQSIRLSRVHGFECDDICIDELGAVFVAGHDWDDEVHIYQIMQAGPRIRQTEDAASITHGDKLDDSDPGGSEDEGIECTMTELSFEDNTRRLANTRKSLAPGKGIVISISGDILALGYDNHLELFHLLP